MNFQKIKEWLKLNKDVVNAIASLLIFLFVLTGWEVYKFFKIASMFESDIKKNAYSQTLDRSTDVAGPDINHNGIRDDIDKYIETQAKIEDWNDLQIKAVQQDAKATQVTLTINSQNKKASDDASEGTKKSINCIFKQFNQKPPPSSFEIEKLTVNTKTRWIAYSAYNSSRSGSVGSMDDKDDDCVR